MGTLQGDNNTHGSRAAVSGHVHCLYRITCGSQQPDPVLEQDQANTLDGCLLSLVSDLWHHSSCGPLQMAPSNLLESKFAMLEGLGGSLDDDLNKLKADLRLKGKLPDRTGAVVPNSIIWE